MTRENGMRTRTERIAIKQKVKEITKAIKIQLADNSS